MYQVDPGHSLMTTMVVHGTSTDDDDDASQVGSPEGFYNAEPSPILPPPNLVKFASVDLTAQMDDMNQALHTVPSNVTAAAEDVQVCIFLIQFL